MPPTDRYLLRRWDFKPSTGGTDPTLPEDAIQATKKFLNRFDSYAQFNTNVKNMTTLKRKNGEFEGLAALLKSYRQPKETLTATMRRYNGSSRTMYCSDSDDEKSTDENIPSVAVVKGTPAYAIDTWNVGRGGPQCSQHPEFCYFCAFRKPDDDDAASDSDNEADDQSTARRHCTGIWTVVDDLVEDNRELPHIVATVYRLYDKHIRPTTKYVAPDTNQIHTNPEWTKDSIKRHLLFSRAYPQLFDGVVSNVYRSLIVTLNNTVVDESTGHVIEDRRVSLVHTLGQYAHWRKTEAVLSSRCGKTRRRRPPKSVS